MRANRDDDFGKATLIETAGGGVEAGEDLDTAIRRELKEELGADVEILCKIGVVSDYYNLINRHNVNNPNRSSNKFSSKILGANIMLTSFAQEQLINC